jgi:putative MATE family efflux protein
MSDVLEQRTRRFTEGALLPVLLRLALPVIASITLQTLYQLVNAFWLGRVGATAVAVVSITTPLTLLLVVLGSGLSTAGLILVAQFSGARNHVMVNRVAAQTLVMVLAISLVLCAVGLLITRPVLHAMSVSPQVLDGATVYLTISYAGLTASYLFVMGQSILQGAGEVRFPLLVVAASVVLNAVLDPVLIFRFQLGVAGAAWATVISQTITAIVGVAALFTGRFGIRIRGSDFKLDPGLLRTSIAIGLPASIEQSTRTLASLLLTALAARFGTAALASFGLGMRVIMLFFIPALGLAAATATVVGQNLGAGLPRRAREAARVSGLFSFGVLTVAGLLFIPLTGVVAHLLVPADDTVAQLAASFVAVVAPAFGIIGAQQVFAGAFRGAGQTLQAMALSLIMQWGFQLPISFACSYYTSLGLRALWWGFPLGNALALMVTLYWFWHSRWQART